MFCKWLCLFLLGINVIYSGNYPYRDINSPPNPLPKKTRILQCSPPKTGSTLIFNVLQYLFEDKDEDYSYRNFNKKVVKIHSFDDIEKIEESDLIISTIRNPLDTLASYLVWKNNVDISGKVNISEEYLEHVTDIIIRRYNRYHSFFETIPKNKLLVFRYEQFDDNFPFIFSKLEDFFHITINQKTRKAIEKYFNKDAMQKLSENYDAYKDYHPLIGIHGNHINNSNWKKNIPVKYHKFLLNKFHDVLVLFGYPVD